MKFKSLFTVILICTMFTAKGQRDFPYSFNTSSKYLLATGVITQGVALWMPDPTLTPADIAQLNPHTINRFDRGAAYEYSEAAHKTSDQTLNMLMVSPAFIGAAEWQRSHLNNALIYGGMYIETFLLTNSIKDLTKDIVKRTRPLFYNPNLSLDERYSLAEAGDARTSFFSGHTAVAFSSAVFLASTYDDLYDNKTMSAMIWTGGLMLASTTGYMRYKAGKHFPTDIITGAIFGAACGYLVPKSHLSAAENWSLNPIPQGLRIAYQF
jgi:membrane-associated phospholipid phosphatase